jgi:hypothetical protein
MPYQIADVRVIGVGLETEFVLERYSEGEDEVQGCKFGEEVVLLERAGPFIDMDPDIAG